MKEDNTHLFNYLDIIIFLFGTGGLLIGFFYDLTISKVLVNEENFIGIFTAIYGEIPGYILILISLIIILTHHIQQHYSDHFELSFISIFFIILHILFILIASYLIIHDIVLNPYYRVVLTLIIPVVLFVIISSRKKLLDEFYVSASKKIFKITLIFPLLIVSGIKTIWGRTRFRDLSADFSEFTHWVFPQGYTGDRSFPSGHSSMGWLFLASILFVKNSTYRMLLLVLSVLWGIMVSLGRILIGAHYLSDVTFSTMIGLLIIHYFYKKQKLEFKDYVSITD